MRQSSATIFFWYYFLRPYRGFSAPLGTGGGTKTDEISEKFQTAFDRPPSFSETYIAFFSENPCLKPCIKVQNLKYEFLDWKRLKAKKTIVTTKSKAIPTYTDPHHQAPANIDMYWPITINEYHLGKGPKRNGKKN